MFDSIGELVAYQLLGLEPSSRLGAALQFFFSDVPKILFLLSIAIFVISIIRSYFPPEKTKQFLTKRHSIVGHVLAALIGVLTPFCSCSAVPLFIGFIEAGVPLGIAFSFLISSPMVNEIALILLFGMFGWKVALFYAISGLIIAIFAGIILGQLHLEHLLESFAAQTPAEPQAAVPQNFHQRCSNALAFTKELIQYIWLYIVIAIAIGGFIHGYVPEGFLVQYAGRANIFAVPLVVLIGVPLYNNASGMVPIVYALMEKGLPLGTTLAFMMAVSAISFPEMIILRKVLKPKLVMIFASILTVAIIFTGYLFNIIE